MIFTTPLWLLGLIPWLALTAWLLRGRHEDARVPFLKLWPARQPRPASSRALRVPPVWLIFLLLSILFAILGAARPQLTVGRSAPPLSFIVDRDLALSARYGQSSRLRGLRETAAEPLRRAFGRASLPVTTVPDGPEEVASSFRTLDALRSTVRQTLEQADGHVIVFSEQTLQLDDARLIQIALAEGISNVGIVNLAAREDPAPQVMVVLRNDSSLTRAELVISTDGDSTRRSINLPSRAGESSYFIDLPRLGQVVSVALLTDDDLAADNRAWLVRQRTWPMIEPQSPLSPELAHMIDVYRRLRHGGDGSKRVAVTARADDSSDNEATVIVAAPPAAKRPPGGAVLRVEDHPITANIDWNRMVSDGRVAAAPPGAWRPLVTVGNQVLVAVREAPTRRVWIAFDSDTWARTSDFVVFWTNVLDWAGQGGEEFVGERMQEPDGDWTRRDDLSDAVPLPLDPPPGVYGRPDGATRALNAIDVRVAVAPPARTEWRERLTRVRPRGARGRPLAAPTSAVALGCAMISSLAWGRPARKPRPT